MYRGHVPKQSLFAYLQRFGMTWRSQKSMAFPYDVDERPNRFLKGWP